MKKQTRKTNTDVSRRDFVRKTAAGIGGVGAAALAGFGSTEAGTAEIPKRWDRTADVVVVGAGAAGMPAAIEAAENGASVIVIEQNYDIGGHAIQSGGAMPLGGGTSLQKKYGIEDSPDRYFYGSDQLARLPVQRQGHRARLCRLERSDVRVALKDHGVRLPRSSPGDSPTAVLRP